MSLFRVPFPSAFVLAVTAVIGCNSAAHATSVDPGFTHGPYHAGYDHSAIVRHIEFDLIEFFESRYARNVFASLESWTRGSDPDQRSARWNWDSDSSSAQFTTHGHAGDPGLSVGNYLFGGRGGRSWQMGHDFSCNPPLTATPLPAALPLFAAGLGLLGLLGWRQRRPMVSLVG